MFSNEIIAIIAGLTGVVAGLAIYVAQRIARRTKEQETQLRDTYLNRLYDLWNSYYKELEAGLKGEIKADYETYLGLLLTNYERSWRNLLVHFPGYPTRTDIDEISNKFDEIKKRMEEIENRFPKEATLEKIASVNDAILATKVEALSDSIKRIEDKLLTKWHVAIVVFAVLGGLGVLVGIVFGVLTLVGGG